MPDARRILLIRALRAFAYGFGSVLLGVSLEAAGFSGTQVGVILTVTLAGSAALTALLGYVGDRIGRRVAHIGLSLLMAGAGTVFALTDSFWVLLLAALSGTVATAALESGPFVTLEQAIIPQTSPQEQRNRVFGLYNAVAALAGCAALPAMVFALCGARHRGSALCGSPLAQGGDRAEGRTESEASAKIPAYSDRPLRALRAGRFRRGLRPAGVHRLLVPGALRRAARTAWPGVLRSRRRAIDLVPYCSAAGGAHRAREHNGLHPPALKRLAGRHPLRTQSGSGARLAPRPLRALPDGRSRPAVVCGGGGGPRRAHRRRQRNERNPNRGAGRLPSPGGSPAPVAGVGRPIHHRGDLERYLQSRPPRSISQHQTRRGDLNYGRVAAC